MHSKSSGQRLAIIAQCLVVRRWLVWVLPQISDQRGREQPG
jgi:hypothetical protein